MKRCLRGLCRRYITSRRTVYLFVERTPLDDCALDFTAADECVALRLSFSVSLSVEPFNAAAVCSDRVSRKVGHHDTRLRWRRRRSFRARSRSEQFGDEPQCQLSIMYTTRRSQALLIRIVSPPPAADAGWMGPWLGSPRARSQLAMASIHCAAVRPWLLALPPAFTIPSK